MTLQKSDLLILEGLRNENSLKLSDSHTQKVWLFLFMQVYLHNEIFLNRCRC